MVSSLQSEHALGEDFCAGISSCPSPCQSVMSPQAGYKGDSTAHTHLPPYDAKV